MYKNLNTNFVLRAIGSFAFESIQGFVYLHFISSSSYERHRIRNLVLGILHSELRILSFLFGTLHSEPLCQRLPILNLVFEPSY